ncbi:MAG: hypothetical protein WCA81_06515 [Rhizomicrobium sp.]
MSRVVGGVIAGIAAWIVIVTALNIGLRHYWPDYAAVERAMTFTLPMMAARLSMSALSSLLGGIVARLVDKRRLAALISGTILLLLFLPEHYALWARFPIWYHLIFLVSLPVFSMLGGDLLPAKPA